MWLWVSRLLQQSIDKGFSGYTCMAVVWITRISHGKHKGCVLEIKSTASEGNIRQ